MARTRREKEDMYALLKCMLVLLKVEKLDYLFNNAINDIASGIDEVKVKEEE